MDNAPDERVRTHLFLAEAAQLVGGKLYALGGGLAGQSVPVAGVALSLAIAGTIECPWTQNNRPHDLLIEMLSDGDGAPYTIPGVNGEQPLRMSARFNAAVPPQLPRGSSSAGAFAVQFMLPVTRSGLFYFKISVDGTETQRLHYALQVGQQPPGVPG